MGCVVVVKREKGYVYDTKGEKISQQIENGDGYSYEIELTRFPHDSVVEMNHPHKWGK